MRRMRAVALLVLACLAAGSISAQIHFTATLSATQENPPTASTAGGTGSFTLSEDRTELRYVVSYQGLTGNLSGAGGHFHVGRPGVNGPVVRGIAAGAGPSSGTVVGVWKSSDATQPFTPALAESLLAGRLYVNFHTAASPGGEIRGQVELATALMFTADYRPEPGSTAPGAGGTGVFVLSPGRDEVAYRISYHGLSGNLSGAGGHIHTGAPGVSGAIVKNLAAGNGPSAGTVRGTWKSSDASQPLTAALLDSLFAGKLYANFHTAASPGGEIRGQLTLSGGLGFAAALDSAQENPPTTSSGTGTAWVSLNEARDQVTYAITYLNLTDSLSVGGHFHAASIGRNGSVVRNVGAAGAPPSATVSGTWKTSDPSQPLTQALIDSLLSGRLYVNFHTKNNPGGEIRGQVLPTTGVGFTARLNAAQETPPGTSLAEGTASVALSPDGNSVTYSVTYFGLSDTLTAGGHFHTGLPGISGPVVKGIASHGGGASGTIAGTWSSTDATQPLTRALVDSLLMGKVYVNFHTAAKPAGEIRGQVLPGTPATVTSVETAEGGLPARFELAQNYPNPFNPSTTIRFSIAKTGLVSLKVYNILGQEVATLVNGQRGAGSYLVTYDAAGLASGVYFYRLTADGAQVETRKMMLLK